MNYKKLRVDRMTHKKAYFVLFFFILIALATVGILFKMQVVDYDYYQDLVVKQVTTEIEVNPERGEIYDTNYNVLATNITRYLLFISPQDIIDAMEEPEKNKVEAVFAWDNFEGYRENGLKMNELIAKYLSGLIDGVEYDDVMEKAAKKGRRYEVIAKMLDEDTADEIRNFVAKYNLKMQIHLTPTPVRYYPYNDLASHVIGFTDADGKGVYGIEAYYNNIMEGKSGRYITAQDARHQDMPFEYETYVEAENGHKIVTTIDNYIQFELQNQLENAYADHGPANRVCGIVMNVKTGAILAMDTEPSFDLNEPRTLDEASQAILSEYTDGTDEYAEKRLELLFTMWKNKAISETYEPGSTFKIITTAMALEDKVVTPNDYFTCTGSLTVEGYDDPIHCHQIEGHGTIPFRVGLQQSCNPTLMQVAFRVGRERFYNYFKQFGYSDLTGIDLPGEVSTLYHSYEYFGLPSLAVYSFGQTFKTTPLQQITAISAVANGGYLVTPHVLKEIADDGGNVLEKYETDVKRQVVSTEVCRTITEILEEGVSGDGGARNAYTKGYKVAAKTGTSQKRDKEGDLNVGSCVAFAPADDPQIAVLFMVDEPMNGAIYGSVVAAPYVSNLLSSVLPYLGYEPSYTEEELRNAQVTVSNYVGATVDTAEADLGWREVNYEIIGGGDTVTSQIPPAGSTFSKESGILYLYTDGATATADIAVPDLVGKTAEAANRIIVNLGLNVSISGATNGSSAVVTSQSPAAETLVPKGSLVTIEMIHQITSDD
ncbi:MAG: PASTA domain-containing protein [Clostridia bacterium]|nr:PASTA domain-containing protein [Clostridia bacterium]